MEEKLKRLISRYDIASAVQRLASDLDRDYRDCSPVLVGILKGAFVFLSDLARHMTAPIGSVEFIQLSSYGHGIISSGRVRVIRGLPRGSIKGRDVIVVEDIVDTGITTAVALRYIRRLRPATLSLCVLLDKPSRRRVPVAIDYLGFTVPDVFVVGYGLDKGQRYRELPEIYEVEG